MYFKKIDKATNSIEILGIAAYQSGVARALQYTHLGHVLVIRNASRGGVALAWQLCALCVCSSGHVVCLLLVGCVI